MALLQDILRWATDELLPWQSDAVRRLIQRGTLDEPDLADLAKMLRAHNGLAVVAAPAPIRLAEEHLPAPEPKQAEPLVLTALENLKHVNRLAPKQKLDFVARGLTVIHGDNGAGKSGYSRVIKAACRARVKEDPVLPDARQHELLHETPSATFIVYQNNTAYPVAWAADKPAPAELASVAILDTKCARAYTDQEGELTFAPWGLDIVENLARNVFPKLTEGVQIELDACNASDAGFADLKLGDTAVAKFLAKLTHLTTDAEAEAAAAFSPEDAERLAFLTEALAEKSPAERAKSLRDQAARLRTLVAALETAGLSVGDAEVQRLQSLDGALIVALQAEQAAAARMRGDGQMLAGTGEAAWESLYSAAAAFVAQHEHSVEAGAPCPLCQSPLDEGAAARLGRFAAYVADSASAQATQQREIQQQELVRLRALTCDPNLDAVTVSAVGDADAKWAAQRSAFVEELQARRDWLVRALAETHDWSHCPAVDADVTTVPNRLIAVHEAAALAFDAIKDAGAKVKLETEAAELSSRHQLSLRREALLALLAAKRKAHALGICLAQLRTKPISDKAGQLASGAITKQLGEALNDEFERLGVAHLQAKLKARNDKGKPKVKLVLGLPSFDKPEQILSEGEQRVIAIASFFAELKASGHRGPAVFDDPVSSLDHQRRQSVALRLVEEAAHRQVIVFTHDTIFLAELMVALEQAPAVSSLFWHLTYSQAQAGYVNEGLPWQHLKTTDRIDAMEKWSRQFEANEQTLTNDKLDETVRQIYGKLREVIERGVEEVVFAGVLSRYNDYVRVPNIIDTVGLQAAECEPLQRLYKKAGDILQGHDKSGARGLPRPSAANVKADIAELRAALQSIRDRRKAAKAT
ncbi:AAA family ATPase [Pelomonas sp. APW6]|uniref:AAA family ATPase n=1 Tax=Roseateles subflavus TaxID=3053353 RepID=A0ABT7LP25_9BURK|nr:AAA family ATPase [Pelomonas sp. APW6]MDL5034578.1 AAA family ATPase [Pelomonas sp. APW6]